jgi:type IV secretory pathway TrbF-like protein
MSTSRRAALGAILAAPLASVPAVSAATLSEPEARFLALAPKLLALCELHDRVWPLSREPYEQWCREIDRSNRPWREGDDDLPSYHAYCAARAPADRADEEAFELCKPFEDVRFTSFEAILLRHRVNMTFDWLSDEAADDLTAIWQLRSVT